MGKLGLGKFFPPPMIVDQDCHFHNEFTGPLQQPVEQLFDAVLYLGPQDLRLWEKVPADFVLDTDYMKERRPEGLDQQILERAENPLFVIHSPPPDPAAIENAIRDCRERKLQAPPK